MKRSGILLVSILVFTLWLPLAAQDQPVATFSIVARDGEAGELGIAVASKFFSVGSVVPWARAASGAVAPSRSPIPASALGGWTSWTPAQPRNRS